MSSMSEQELTDFLILRSLDEPITEDELEDAAAQSGDVLQELRAEGNEIRWIESEIMTNEDGKITGTFCQYRAEEKELIHEHADRAGLPATRVDRRGEPLEGE